MFTVKHWIPPHSQTQQQLLISGDRKDIYGTSAFNIPYTGFGDDPDRLDTNDILSKLSQYQDKSYLPLINTVCECYKTASSNYTEKRETLSDILKEDSLSSSSEEEEEDEDLSFEYVIQKLDAQRRKSATTTPQKVLIALIRNYKGQEILTSECIHKLIAYLHTENIVMREAGLILLQQCCNHGDNVKLLIELGVLNDLELIITSRDCRSVHPVALDSLRKVMEHTVLKCHWWDPVQALLPKLLTKLTNEKLADIKVAILKILKILSNEEEGASWVTAQGMPVLTSMKERNTDVKECFADILSGLVCHGDPLKVGNLDNRGVNVGLDLLQSGPCGPQVQSLKLISSLVKSSTGLTDVVSANVVPYVLSALRDSKCRKVKAGAAGVLSCILATRKPGQIREILKQVWEFFELSSVERHRQEGGTGSHGMSGHHAVYPVKLKTEAPVRLDVGLEKLVKVIVEILYQEGCVELGAEGRSLCVRLKPGVDKGLTRLTALSNSLAVLQTICCLPWNKSPNSNIYHFPSHSANVSALTDNESRRLNLSRINTIQTLSVWDACGLCVVDLLIAYAEKFHRHRDKTLEKARATYAATKIKSPINAATLSKLSNIFSKEELVLITSLMDILLIFAFCSCEQFENLGDKKYQSYKSQAESNDNSGVVATPTRPRSAKPNVSKKLNLKQKRPLSGSITCVQNSNQPIVIPVAEEEDVDDQLEAMSHKDQRKTESPRMKISSMKSAENLSKGNQSWVGNNRTVFDRHQIDSFKKEGDIQRRQMRRMLFEAGVFEAVSPLIMCSDIPYKVQCLEILRCMVQPLGEKTGTLLRSDSDKFKKLDRRVLPQLKQRPQSACSAHERARRLKTAMQGMSAPVAKVIAEALEDDCGYRPLQLVARHNTPSLNDEGTLADEKTASDSTEELSNNKLSYKPKVDVTQPISDQCRIYLLDSLKSDLLTGLFNPSRSVKRHTLLLLEDLVCNGDVSLYMKLSEYGCIPKLVDFLRVNEDDELMEITALIVTRMLVVSDWRLKDVFDRHGGSSLLMAMTRYTKGILREEVALTLKTVNKAASSRGRPQSAPAGLRTDIWEQINKRWQQEDKVSEILQQWNN